MTAIGETNAHVSVKQDDADVNTVQRVGQILQRDFVRPGDHKMTHSRLFHLSEISAARDAFQVGLGSSKIVFQVYQQ
jgi:hypothetical protein